MTIVIFIMSSLISSLVGFELGQRAMKEKMIKNLEEELKWRNRSSTR